MKARFSSQFAFGLALSLLPFVGACTEDSAEAVPRAVTVNAAAAVADSTATNETAPPVAAPEPAPPAVVASEPSPSVVEPAPGAEKKLLTNIRSNSPAVDVAKMAQAGVDTTVMLNYITNSSGMFMLSAEEIIYLADIGVPSEVVTAMMQRDQVLKEFWASAGKPAEPVASAAAVPPADAQAAAPTYVNPPQPEAPAVETTTAPTTPPATVVNNNYFYDTLSPYGTWVEIEGYGRCWQPTAVVLNPGWRPYGDRGHWVYSDCGWYWMSDYSWGATTFHYGRWFSHPRWGWCWWPDTVWAPSWVTFRYDGGYCGWAALPPHAYYRPGFGFSYYGRSVGFGFDFGLGATSFTFVSWNNFCDSRPWHHRVPHHEVTRIYNRTTIVNNYGSGNNHTVFNRGITPERYRELAHRDLRPVTVRTEARPGNRGERNERFERDGRSIVVNRPPAVGERNSSAPAAHAQPPRNRVVENDKVTRPIVGRPTEEPRRPDVRTGTVRPPLPERGANNPAETVRRERPASAPPVMSPRQLGDKNPSSTAPAGSLVVIGKRDPNNNTPWPNRANSTPQNIANPSPNTPAPAAPATSPNPVVVRSSTQASPAAPVQREPSVRRSNPNPGSANTRAESPAPRTTQTWTPPAATPQPVTRPQPTFQRPANNYNPQPAPQRSVTPAPAYTPPARVNPAPAPQPSQSYTPPPSRPANVGSRPSPPERPAQRNEGGGGGGSRGRRDN